MSRFFPAFLTILIIALLGGGGFFVLNILSPEPEQADAPPPGLSVFVEPVERTDLTFVVQAQGEVRPQREIIVAPQIAGRIAFVSPDFIDGGFIRKGQVLVQLEAADYELGVVRAKAGVASAQQQLAREEAEAEIARQDLENLGIIDSSPLARREPQLLDAKAALESARAQLADAELALARTAIRSPFTGRVRQKSVDVGQFVSAGQSLGQIFATDIVEVVLPISDSELGRLGIPIAFAETEEVKGPDVLFRASVGGVEREWKGRVVRSAAAVNSQTRLITVIAVLDDPFGEGADNGAPMAPGLFVNAEIQGAVVPDVLMAPRGALRAGNQIFLGNPETGTLEIVEVEVIYSDPSGAWFRSDRVNPGNLSITSPVQAAFTGMTIRLIEQMPDGTMFTHSAPIREVRDTNGPSQRAQTSGAKGGTQ